MPLLTTTRLRIRPFQQGDLSVVHRLLDHDAWQTGRSLAEREQWLRWSELNHQMLSDANQPPYGERAIALLSTGEVVGVLDNPRLG